MKLKGLDLYCGEGGASMGLARAGLEMTGVDIRPQKRYPFRFIQADALEVELGGYDFIWASPPCQRYSMYSRNMGTNENHPDLVEPTRKRLVASGTPWVMENVPGSPLKSPFMLCGSAFGLGVRRHRLFEASFRSLVLAPPCRHEKPAIPVFGHGTPQWHRKKLGRNISIEEKKEAMGIDWMSRDGLSLAIPPAYSEFIATTWLSQQDDKA